MRILANDGISKSGKSKLEEAGFQVDVIKIAQKQLASYIKKNNIDVLLIRSATKVHQNLIDACKKQLKLIGRGGVGMDNIDVDHAKRNGIRVINTPTASSRSVAELVFAHLFGMARYLFDANQKMPLEGDSKFEELKKNYSAGIELKGKTLGIIGFGFIGQEVARIAYGFGMNVIAHKRSVEEKTLEIDFVDGQTIFIKVNTVSLEEVLKYADFITIHISGAGQVIIEEKEINMMKNNAGIINTARAGIVDEEALLKALNKGKLRYAALDVFVNEPTPSVKVLMSPYTSLSPHIGAATIDAQERIGKELAEQIIELLPIKV